MTGATSKRVITGKMGFQGVPLRTDSRIGMLQLVSGESKSAQARAKMAGLSTVISVIAAMTESGPGQQHQLTIAMLDVGIHIAV